MSRISVVRKLLLSFKVYIDVAQILTDLIAAPVQIILNDVTKHWSVKR